MIHGTSYSLGTVDFIRDSDWASSYSHLLLLPFPLLNRFEGGRKGGEGEQRDER